MDLSSYVKHINESLSDDDVYYIVGKHKYNWNKASQEKYDAKYGTPHKRGIIKMMKDISAPLMNRSGEVIGRNRWDLPGLVGETEKQLLHPHYWVLTEYIKKYFKPSNDILTVMECSNSKPYGDANHLANLWAKRYRMYSDFACISNPGVIPFTESSFYPYRYDEWDHFAEKPDIAEKYVWVNISRIIEWKRLKNYKKVFVIMQSEAPQAIFDKMWDENIENCREWLVIVTTKEWRDNAIKKLIKKFSNRGLAITRLISHPLLQERYQSLLEKEVGDISDLKTSIKQGSKHIQAYYAEQGYDEYKLSDGKAGEFEVFDPMDMVDESIVSDYEKYIKDKISKFEYEIDDENKHHEKFMLWTILDLLMDYHKDKKYIKEIDKNYWCMYKAMLNVNDKKIVRLNIGSGRHDNFIFYYKPYFDELKFTDDDIIKYTNDLGISQYGDERVKEITKLIK